MATNKQVTILLLGIGLLSLKILGGIWQNEYTPTKKSQCCIIVIVVTSSISLTETKKNLQCPMCEERRIFNAPCTTNWNLDNITIIQGGIGTQCWCCRGSKKWVNSEWIKMTHRSETKYNDIAGTWNNSHGEEVLLMLPERNSLKRQENKIWNRH